MSWKSRSGIPENTSAIEYITPGFHGKTTIFNPNSPANSDKNKYQDETKEASKKKFSFLAWADSKQYANIDFIAITAVQTGTTFSEKIVSI